MNKKLFLIPSFMILLLDNIMAHCPLCTGATVAGAIGAKYYGFDVTLVGLFMGAFATSFGLWFNRKAKVYFRFQKTILIIVLFALTIIPAIPFIKDLVYFPLFMYGDYGSILNRIYSVNKFLLGSIIGAIITLFAYYLHNKIKISHGRVLFPYQGVILTILLLVLAGIPIYFIFS